MQALQHLMALLSAASRGQASSQSQRLQQCWGQPWLSLLISVRLVVLTMHVVQPPVTTKILVIPIAP